MKRVVIEKINIMRQDPNRTKWQPSKEAVICHMHYLNFKGPSKPDNDVTPIYLKRPRRDPAVTYPPKKGRLLQRCTTTREAENLKTRATDDLQTEQNPQQCIEGQGNLQAEQNSQQCIEEQGNSQAEQDSPQYTEGQDNLQAEQDPQQCTEGQDDSPAKEQYSHHVDGRGTGSFNS